MRTIELGLWAAEQESAYWVPAKKALSLTKQKFSEMGIDRSDVQVQIMATSALGDTPSAQIDMLEKLQDKGMGSPEDYADQILDPVIYAYLNRIAAPTRVVEIIVEAMREGEAYQPPEPLMDLQLAMMTAQAMYLEALEAGDVPDEALRNVRKFMNGISSLVMLSQQKQADAGPGASRRPRCQLAVCSPGMPPGAPMPPQLPPGGSRLR